MGKYVRYINNYFLEKICGFLAATHIPKSSESLFVSLQRVHCIFDLAFQFRVVYTFSDFVFHFYVPELEESGALQTSIFICLHGGQKCKTL